MTPSVAAKTGKKPALSPEQWRAVWREKTERALRKQGAGKDVIKRYDAAISNFLQPHACHPASIPAEAITGFIYSGRAGPEFDRETLKRFLSFFYCHVAPSPQIVEAIARIDGHGGQKAALPEKDDQQHLMKLLLGKLVEELKLRNYSRQTVKNYYASVQEYLSVLKRQPAPGDAPEIKRFQIYLKDTCGFAPRTVNLAAAAISFFYRHVIGNPEAAAGVPRMKPGKNLPKVYSAEDVERMINAAGNDKHRLVLMFAYGCGLRLGEIQGIRPEAIDWDRKVIQIRGKGSKERQVMLDPTLAAILKRHLDRNPKPIYIFEGIRPGSPYPKRTIEKIFENACRVSGVQRKGGIHSLRHTFATHLLEQGTGLRQIQEILGHSSIKTTEIYTHVSNKEILKIRSPLANINIKPGTT